MRSTIRHGLLLSLLAPASAGAQYGEVPRPLPVPVATEFGQTRLGTIAAATQIGRRLFVAGGFTRLAPPTGQAVVVGPDGQIVPGRFPYFAGNVHQIVSDNAGGWLVVGAFTSVDGQPIAGLARVAPDRTVDRRYRLVADGAVRKVALAHGRIYVVGDFTSINGTTRRGLAALDAVSGALTAWGSGFDPRGTLGQLSISSVGVYVSGGSDRSHVWGFEAATGRLLFDRLVGAAALAATSSRVYVTGFGGYRRPLMAIDPLTGQDTDWAIGATFEYIPVTYGWDGTEITSLLVDGPRLYLAGRFRSSIGDSIAAVDAASGQPVGWQSVGLGIWGDSRTWLTRARDTVVVGFAGGVATYRVTTGATVSVAPAVAGAIDTLAVAPEGAAIGGAFAFASGGVERNGLAAIDLDSGTVDTWTSPFSAPLFEGIADLATDGRWLLVQSGRDYSSTAVRLSKIDPDSGAVVAALTLPSAVTRMRVSGGDLVVSTYDGVAGESAIGVVTVADWSYRRLATKAGGQVLSLDVDGDRIYLAGSFATVGGQDRPRAAAIHRVTGAVLPWRPAPSSLVTAVVRASGGRVWLAGDFRRVGGARRLGLAELDPVTGAALAWNPQVTSPNLGGVVRIEVGSDGLLYASTGAPFSDGEWGGFAAGQVAPSTVAYDLETGARLPWRPTVPGLRAVTVDCLLTEIGCLAPATLAPSGLGVAQSGASLTFTWSLAPATTRTGVRLEVGRADGSADLATIDLASDQQSYTTVAPPGRYFARVRALAGPATSRATPDVSFAVGPPVVPGAPLDLTAVTDGPTITFSWQPPSTGAPPLYEIEAGTARGRRDIGVLSLPGGITTFSIDVPVGEYWVRLAAVNVVGRSAPSNDTYVNLSPGGTCGGPPPTKLAASVAGRVVTLTWRPAPDDDTPPLIVAGSAPGLSDLAILSAPAYASSFSASVPPGVYYVRMETGCFSRAASNEVQVVVP